MTHPICLTCGTQFAALPPHGLPCPICADERQYIGHNGQQWSDHAALSRTHVVRIADDDGLTGLGLDPPFAIEQRALLLPDGSGSHLLWECLSVVTEAAVRELRARGGVRQIVISHPHFYAGMIEWSRALGDVPVWLHAADRAWVQRPDPAIRYWEGDTLVLDGQYTLLRCGGHFAGSTALHWRDGPRGGGALLPGDALQVVADRRHVSFMYSYPNLLPMRTSDVLALRARVSGLQFEDVYGYTWGRNIIGDGRAAVGGSFARYLAQVHG